MQRAALTPRSCSALLPGPDCGPRRCRRWRSENLRVRNHREGLVRARQWNLPTTGLASARFRTRSAATPTMTPNRSALYRTWRHEVVDGAPRLLANFGSSYAESAYRVTSP